jgi:hypothetical protein
VYLLMNLMRLVQRTAMKYLNTQIQNMKFCEIKWKSKMCNNEYRYDYYLKEHEKTCKVLPSILCDICGEILGN